MDARRHGELLSAFIDQVLRSAGVSPARPDRHRGRAPAPAPTPACGSAWSPRGCSARPGRARSTAICTLDVIAASAAGAAGGREFLVATDARRKELYWARYCAAGERVDRARRSARPPTCRPACRWRARARVLYPELVAQAARARLPVRGRAGRAGRRADRGRDAPGAAAAALPAPARRPGAGPAQAGDPVTTPGPAAAGPGRAPADDCGRPRRGAGARAGAVRRGGLVPAHAGGRAGPAARQPPLPGRRAGRPGRRLRRPAGRGHPGRRGHHRGQPAAGRVRAPARRCWPRCWPRPAAAAAPRSSWRCGWTTCGPSGCTAARGFEQIGIRRGYYQPSGADALVMRRSLAAEPGQAGDAAGDAGAGAAEATERGAR